MDGRDRARVGRMAHKDYPAGDDAVGWALMWVDAGGLADWQEIARVLAVEVRRLQFEGRAA
jgi:hypothetical protein